MYAGDGVHYAAHLVIGPNASFIGPPCGVIAVYALCIYDFLLQLDNELRLVFKSKWTWCTFLYYFSRYYPVVVWPFHIWAWAHAHDTETCERVLRPLYILIIPLQTMPQVVIIARAWGFTQRNPFVLAGLSAIFTIFVGLQFWTYLGHLRLSHGKYRKLGRVGCVRSYHEEEELVNSRMGALMLGAIGVDGAATLVVIVHYIKEYRENGNHLRRAFSHYFVKQGLAYYSLIVTFNVVTGLLWFRAKNIFASFGFVITLVVPNLLACRLILQCRECEYKSTDLPTDHELDEFVTDGLKRAEGIQTQTLKASQSTCVQEFSNT